MASLFRRFVVFSCAVAFSASGGYVQAAVYSLRAVKVNNTNIAPTSTVIANPGDRIEAHVFLRGWDADHAGSRVKSLQYTIAGNENFYNALLGDLNVAQPGCYDIPTPVRCDVDLDCASLPDRPKCLEGTRMCGRPCAPEGDPPIIPDPECTAGFPVCRGAGNVCVGLNHDPDACTFIDVANPDWLYSFLFPNRLPVSACAFRGFDIACGSAINEGIPPLDPGTERYVGTVTFDLTDQACGAIVPAITTVVGSFVTLVFSGGEIVVVPAVENLTINVQGNDCTPCPTLTTTVPTNCTVDARTPNSLASANPNFWFNDNFDFVLNFTTSPEGGFVQGDFSVVIDPSQPSPVAIDSFSAAGSQVNISVVRPPSFTGGARWLCIEYENASPSCDTQKVCWARLPGDVDGNGTVTIVDLTALLGGLNTQSLPTLRCDMDRSGACRASDILTWIDIANGANALAQFLGVSLPACPSAP